MNIKQKLGLGALVLGMSGCSEYKKNLSTDVIEPRADEVYFVNTTDLPSCLQADVQMDVNGYLIQCKDKGVFIGSFNVDNLRWRGNDYWDFDQDGKLDMMWVEGVSYPKEVISSNQNDFYSKVLKNLSNDTVKKVWIERWRPSQE